jgi:hypothetical protein
MPDREYRAKIIVDKQGDGAKKAADELKNLQSQVKATGDETGKLAGSNRKLLDGLKSFGRELPIVGQGLSILRNGWAALGIVAVAAFLKIKKSIEETKAAQERWLGLSSTIQVSIDRYSDLKKAVDAVTDAQKDLAEQTAAANVLLEAQVKLAGQKTENEISILDAEEQRQAALIERDVPAGPERERRMSENKIKFGAQRNALRTRLTGQTAQAIGQQIAAEKRLQGEAVGSVPNEAALRASVAGVEKDRAALEQARRVNVDVGKDFEIARLVSQLQPNEDLRKILDPGQLLTARKLGLIPEYFGTAELVSKANAILPGLGEQRAASLDTVARAQSSLNIALGALPAGVATAADIDPFIRAAESKASDTATASYFREQELQAKLGSVIRGGANAQAVGGIQLQTERIRGGIAVDAATLNDAKAAHGATAAEVMAFLKQIVADGRVTKEELRRLNEIMRQHSQSMGN